MKLEVIKLQICLGLLLFKDTSGFIEYTQLIISKAVIQAFSISIVIINAMTIICHLFGMIITMLDLCNYYLAHSRVHMLWFPVMLPKLQGESNAVYHTEAFSWEWSWVELKRRRQTPYNCLDSPGSEIRSELWLTLVTWKYFSPETLPGFWALWNTTSKFACASRESTIAERSTRFGRHYIRHKEQLIFSVCCVYIYIFFYNVKKKTWTE